jgi:hypothetical protein
MIGHLHDPPHVWNLLRPGTVHLKPDLLAGLGRVVADDAARERMLRDGRRDAARLRTMQEPCSWSK